MAYFAELDNKNVVIRCISVADKDCLDSAGNESEEVGVAFCKALFGGVAWKQTSYTNRIRLNFAGIGMVYHPERDVFVAAPPHPWYELDENNAWRSPMGIHPDTGKPLKDWQWDFLEVAYKLKPSYADFAEAVKQQEQGASNV